MKSGAIRPTSLDTRSGIGSVIRNKQLRLDAAAGPAKPGREHGRAELVYMIKSAAGSRYGDMVDALDEASIKQVKHFSLVKISAGEEAELEKYPVVRQ